VETGSAVCAIAKETSSAALSATVDDSDMLIYDKQRYTIHEVYIEHMKGIVDRIRMPQPRRLIVSGIRVDLMPPVLQLSCMGTCRMSSQSPRDGSVDSSTV
jgi:hypothetical protein